MEIQVVLLVKRSEILKFLTHLFICCYGFPVVMYGCESWTVKKAESRRINAFELWCWRKLLWVTWTARGSSQSILKEWTLNTHWKDWCWSWRSNTLATWCEEQIFFFNFFIIIIYFLFYFTILYWFCHTLTWIHHRCTWVPNPESPSHHPPISSLWVIPVHQPPASCILYQP